MARSITYLVLVTMVLATTIATISATGIESLAQCSKHIGKKCGKQVLDKLFSEDEESIMSLNCCYKLYQMGVPCHTKLTMYILQTNSEFKNASWTEILSKNELIFYQCDKRTQAGSPKFMAECTENLGTKCGAEVYNRLVNDKTITSECCEKLVNVGELCHVNMAKALIRTPQMRNVDAVQLLRKNKKIFKECKED